ncbi:MAG: methyltransferase domain-containing protein [Magnetococcales bacterium]|nr:methyltransferase domain-containing protein [Magnetococcales bacterium]MBF0438270.1 methyltransferase domain-containing protein [Magnetococcales bacterium]
MSRYGLQWVLKRMPWKWRQGVLEGLADLLNAGQLADSLRHLAMERAESLPPEDALRFLMHLDNALYSLHGRNAVLYGNGLHVKHRLMCYHDFFVERVRSGERVLDVGCGNGALTQDMAERSGARVLGIELDGTKVAKAMENPHPLVEFRVGDATALGEEVGQFDVVTLSNVLEHLLDRAAFLRRLQQLVNPSRFLLRVPLFERDWRVPLKRELGVEWRLDPTHETEYSLESFAAEMVEAGLNVRHQEVRWGEIWAEVFSNPSTKKSAFTQYSKKIYIG